MVKSRVWQGAATLLFAMVVSLSLSVGCSKQGEGERCDRTNAGNTDCEDGLSCVDTADNFQRCCPPAGAVASDSRCQPAVVSTSGGGATGSGGASGGGASSGGTNNSGGGQNMDAGASSTSGGQSSSAGAGGN